MSMKTIGPSLESVSPRVLLRGASEVSVELHNRGSAPLTACQVKIYATESCPGVVLFDDAVQWTSPSSEGIMRGVVDATDPTSLAPGDSTLFIIVHMASVYAIEVLASAAAETEVGLWIGTDNINA